MTIEEDLKTIKDNVIALRNDANSTISMIGGLIGTLANVTQLLGLPATLVQLAQLFGGPDPTQQALDRIEGLLQATFSFNAAEADFTQMHLVNDSVVRCRSALQAILQENPPFSQTALEDAQNKTLTETNLLESEPYWQRVFFDQLLYSDYWFGRVPPPPDDFSSPRPDRKFVFDYRLTLLGYLNAISVRTATALLLLKSDFIQKQAAVDEIRNRALALEKFLKRILAGFVPAPVPTLQQIEYSFEGVQQSQFDPIIVPNEPVPRAIGVVQAHDGAGIVDTYPTELFPNRQFGPFFGFPDDLPSNPAVLDFQARYALGLRRRGKDLYFNIGLDHAWQSIQDLRKIIGDPFEPHDLMAYWSLHDIFADLGAAEVLPDDNPVPILSPEISLEDTVRRLEIIGNVDTRQKPRASWREALEAAAV